jgi:hypothetical protein
MVLVIATVEEYATGEHKQTGQQKQKHLKSFLSSVHKITIEHVWVLRGR